MITCSVIGMIYFVLCFTRTLILMTTSVFPMWAILIWLVISMIVPPITPLIVMSIDDEKISNEKSATITITLSHDTEKLFKEWLRNE